MDGTDWEARISAAWESFGELSETDFLALIKRLAAELPPDSGIGFFEPRRMARGPVPLGARRCPPGQEAKWLARRPAYVAIMRA